MAAPGLAELRLATIEAVSADGRAQVRLDGQARRLEADSLGIVTAEAVGSRVAVGFLGGDPERPVITGQISGQISGQITGQTTGAASGAMPAHEVIEAADRLTLKCGKATIVLTKEGKVLIRGAYLSSRSSGVNRIKGGSVQIN
ncbi:MAG: DUF6484 domain-containing protein [Rhodothalassiaceae bacterium]